jgi:hypothetical protein
MIFEFLIPKLQEAFPNRGLIVDRSKKQIVFAAAHPDVGDLDIRDDGSEITLIAGKFTHGHFSNYDDNLAAEEKSKQITDDVVVFLKEVFADQVVFWGSHKGGGGWYKRGKPIEWSKTGLLSKPEKEFVWSGPLP